ncbi:MAG TPA: PAS domain-containing protein [Planctomycetota bacterium]|jgi:PAS domain-containing protein|nr:PAS domain-containing protein [Planctomycetota bacterium]
MSADSADQEQTAIRRVLTENQRLKQRVFELEEKFRKAGSPGESQPSSQGSSVIKLIEHKDFQLQQCQARLEEKKEQLAEATKELAKWADTLRLYQDIFDNDASAMIGVNREGRIILFNRTAPQILGEKFKEALHQPIEKADFGAFDPETPRRVREAMTSRKPLDSTIVVRDRRILTSVRPIGNDAETRGALVRIQVLSGK